MQLAGGGAVYVYAYVQHFIPINDLKGDSEWFLKEHKMGILEDITGRSHVSDGVAFVFHKYFGY